MMHCWRRVYETGHRSGGFAMTRHPIRQGWDRQAEEDIEEVLSSLY